MKIVVTGANGFVGRTVCEQLARAHYAVVALVRNPAVMPPINGVSALQWPEDADGLTSAFEDVNCVVHLAGAAHRLGAAGRSARDDYFRVNRDLVERVADAAARAGVGRFLLLSTAKVHGESTDGRGPFSENDPPNPQDPYAESKWAGERVLLEQAKASFGVTVIRPPLVYGPGVRANFQRLILLVHSGLPLPLASVANARSMIGIGNLCSAIVTCIRSPVALGKTYLVGDAADVSTPDLIRAMARVSGRSARLIQFPVTGLRVLSQIARKKAEFERLCGSFQVSTQLIRSELGWNPPFSMEQELHNVMQAQL